MALNRINVLHFRCGYIAFWTGYNIVGDINSPSGVYRGQFPLGKH